MYVSMGMCISKGLLIGHIEKSLLLTLILKEVCADKTITCITRINTKGQRQGGQSVNYLLEGVVGELQPGLAVAVEARRELVEFRVAHRVDFRQTFGAQQPFYDKCCMAGK